MSSLAPDTELDAGLAAHIAEYHIARGDAAAARDVLERAAVAHPASLEGRRALALAYGGIARLFIAREDVAEAAGMVGKAQTLSDDPEVCRVAAAVATLRGNHALARSLWGQVTATEPDKAGDWLALGRACENDSALPAALDCYLRAVQCDPGHSTVLSVARRIPALAPLEDVPETRRVRIAVLGSATLDHLRSYLEVYCRMVGLVPSFYVGPFGQYAQDILTDDGPLYAFAPDVIILAVHGRAIFPELYTDVLDLDIDARRAICRDAADQMIHLIGQITARTRALVLVHSFAAPQNSPLGIQELREPLGQLGCFRTINEEIANKIRSHYPSAYIIDEECVFGRIGKRHVTDPRLWFLARMPYSPVALHALTQEYLRYIKALKGLTRKCLVLDLDNTLWGGVVGEDGIHGIRLGKDGPGAAYRAFQEAILQLGRRGIILAVASKNNEQDALEVLERHPDMLLRPEHFASLRINWENKASNIASIAAELNIGLDSIVFMDDNPSECAMVRAALPEVLTVQLPRDPASYRSTLADMTDFDSLTLTDEDRRRGALYAQRRQRQEWQARSTADLGSYLTDLQVSVNVAPADDASLPRIAQLIGKTNQFNLTNRRYTETEVRTFAASVAHSIIAVRVRDRFGDHGLVGVAIVAKRNPVWEIDTFLLSCRVLGCGVESAVLSALVKVAQRESVTCLRGLVVPTSKNAPAQSIFSRHGFAQTGEVDGVTLWDLDLRTGGVETPSWVTIDLAY